MHLSESDTRAKYIDPKLKQDGWSDGFVIREYYFTLGRKFVGGKAGPKKFADYLLKFNGVNLAIIEAKKYGLYPTEGLEQVKEYGKILQVRFVYSTNGQQIYEFDLSTGKGDFIENYPTPEELYNKTFGSKNELKEALLKEPYYIVDKKPRYYQEIAINKTIEALGDGKDRILLTLATGTGKTVVAFQIAYKLFNARWSRDGLGKRRPRILFLADRNILVDQAMNTFNPLEKDILKINGSEIKKRDGKVPTNANIFFAIYQALAGGVNEENPEEVLEAYYNRYDKDFFDMIIIDECHRGGAREDGNWAEILRYFSPAVQIGLTATPKREDNVDTYNYFGKPVYEYSLKAGIDDGFLTPFKIKRIKLNIDELAITSGDTVIRGEMKKDVYEIKDFEREIIIDERTDLIAQTILQQINKMDKTIVFCVDQSHALRMRDSLNKYKEVSDPDYCVRVTSDEGAIGRTYLEKFQDNDKDIPVILTSSQMLTTGVDALNVRNIVLVRNIGSIVEYKQIIGRGTRLFDGKDFFTIYDFVGATNEFRDEVWDGSEEGDEVIPRPPKPPKEGPTTGNPPGEPPEPPKEKLYMKLDDGREIKVIDVETRYIDPESGKLLSTKDFLLKLTGVLPRFYKDEQQLRMLWANPETREQLLQSLAGVGIDTEQLDALKTMFEAENSDIFDILAHLSFNADMKYRTERKEMAEKDLNKYTNLGAREFLEFLLQLYVRNGILEFRKDGLSSKLELFNKGTSVQIAKEFGGNKELRVAYYKLQESLYSK
ncbi:DEAD/DEAH box helicase [Candidatus Gracilibacteria bacterium CG1_02_38_174]|nr:MAG: DEAD/DEAH box helicase [Candidatus Gracilibacteria bacterium CG1_02_38_174]